MGALSVVDGNVDGTRFVVHLRVCTCARESRVDDWNCLMHAYTYI
jgi:hypothetical protein